MTVDQLNREISAEIAGLREGEMGEVIFDDEFLNDVPEPDAFLEPPSDVIDGGPESPDDDWRERIKNEHPSILGVYMPMRSPGRVVLFGDRLKRFHKSLLWAIHPKVPYMTKLDLNAAWTVVRIHTHEHELFHYNCNVLRELFNAGFSPDIEEALAVAWARFKIQEERGKWQTQIGRMNGLFYSMLMRKAFDYRSPGYRDWILYADQDRFAPALLDYVKPPGYSRLQANGVDMEWLIYNMIGQMDKGYVQEVL